MKDYKEYLIAQGLDYEGALARFAGNEGLYVSFLTKFLNDNSFTEFQGAMSRGDWVSAAMASHSLKGLSGNLGLTGLYQTCREVTDLLRSEQYEQACAAKPRLEDEYEKVVTTVRGIQNE